MTYRFSEKCSANISDELRDGIKAYQRRISALGGYGVTLTRTMPDGQVRTGTLVEGGFGECQPVISDADGRRWRIMV